MTRIKILDQITSHTCRCDSWLAHWEKSSDEKAECCAVENCTTSDDLLGIPVRIANSWDNNRYIVPLCKKHSNCRYELNVTSKLVPAYNKVICNTSFVLLESEIH